MAARASPRRPRAAVAVAKTEVHGEKRAAWLVSGIEHEMRARPKVAPKSNRRVARLALSFVHVCWTPLAETH